MLGIWRLIQTGVASVADGIVEPLSCVSTAVAYHG